MAAYARIHLSPGGRLLWCVAFLPFAIITGVVLGAADCPVPVAVTGSAVGYLLWCALVLRIHFDRTGQTVSVVNTLKHVQIDLKEIVSVEIDRCGPHGRYLNGAAPCIRLHLRDRSSVAVIATHGRADLNELRETLAQAIKARNGSA